MAATMEEEPVVLDSGEPAASGAQHDGTVTGVLTWFKRERMPGLGVGMPSSEGKRHASNAGATLANVQCAMDALSICRRVDQPVEQRMKLVSAATSFAANAFYVQRAEVMDPDVAKPRAIVVNKGSPGGAAQIRELEDSGEWTSLAVNWIDDSASLISSFTLKHPNGAFFLGERGAGRAALVAAVQELGSIEAMLESHDVERALAAVKAAKIAIAAAIPPSSGPVGGGGEGGNGGGGGAAHQPDTRVCELPRDISQLTIREAVALVEEGPPEMSPLFEWEGASAESARKKAWGENKGEKCLHYKQLKKLKTFFAVYSLLKLRVHWGGDGVLDEKVGSVAELATTASGVFVSGSKFKDTKGAVFLSGRILPQELSDAFVSGGYSAAAIATRSHNGACVVENCGRA